MRRTRLQRALVVSSLVAAAGLAAALAVPPLATSGAAEPAGGLVAFGSNGYGELGSGSSSASTTPNPTPGLATLPNATGPVTAAANGQGFSLAVTSSGQLYSFGDNQEGQLGLSTNSGSANPNATPALVALPGVIGTVTKVAAGVDHSLVVTSSGQLYAFGDNYYGELGNSTNVGTTNPNPTPTLVTLPGEVGTVSAVAAGGSFSLVLTSSGQLYAFGLNVDGQLGIATNAGTVMPNPTPTLVGLPGEIGSVTHIAAGGTFSLVATSSGQLYAFGDNYYGELGIGTNAGTITPVSTPTLVTLPGESGTVTDLAAGLTHGLVVTSGGQLYAFGNNYDGELGNSTNTGSNAANPTPAIVTLPGAVGSVVVASAGNSSSRAVTSSGQLYTFGDNALGELGTATDAGTSTPNPTPAIVSLPSGTTIDAVAIGPAASHTLAIVSDLAVGTSSLPAAGVGMTYSTTVVASGGAVPYAWSATGLPAGLAIAPATGIIAGTPTATGTSSVVITVTDADSVAASVTLSLTVSAVAASTTTTTTTVPASKTPELVVHTTHLVVSSGKATVRVTCEDRACRGSVRLVEMVKVHVEHGNKKVVKTETVSLAGASLRLAAGKSATLALALSPTGHTVLAKVAKHPLHETLQVSLIGATTTSKPVLVS